MAALGQGGGPARVLNRVTPRSRRPPQARGAPGDAHRARGSGLNVDPPTSHIAGMTKAAATKVKSLASKRPKRSLTSDTVIEVPTPPQRPTHFTRSQMRKAVQSLMAQRA